jgi:predicted dehydrogenase
MHKKIKVGIIGLGVGKHHLKCFLNNKHCEVVSVCDFKVSKLNQIKLKEPKINVTTKSSDIINDKNVDLVCIASYDNFHAEQVLNCIKKKKHVFVEKPICTNQKDYFKIKKELNKNPNICLSSNFVLRRSPQFLKLSEMIKKKKLGEIFYISGEYNYGRLSKITEGWRSQIKNYSVTHGGAMHIIDLAINLIGIRPLKVSALGNRISTKKTKFKYNDISTAIIKFENGLILNVVSNFGCVMPHHHIFKVFGTKQSFIQNFNDVKIFNSRIRNNPVKKLSNIYPNHKKKIILENFLDTIVNRKKNTLLNSKDVLNSMAVSIAIDKSIKTKKWEKITY